MIWFSEGTVLSDPVFFVSGTITTFFYSLYRRTCVNARNLTKVAHCSTRSTVCSRCYYVNVSVLIKDQYFYLNYHKFSKQSYVLDVY